MLKPVPMGRSSLPDDVLRQDRKTCRKFGSCGVGEQALYLGSLLLDRRYYVPFSAVVRVFKRIAMSKGGFTGKGAFASIPYLVVVCDDGTERQCSFRQEEQVDQLLAYLAEVRPALKLRSKAAEQRLAEKERARAARVQPKLSDAAQETLAELRRAKAHLDSRPELSRELSQAARRKRAYLQSSPSYKWVALAITLMGFCSLAYGVYTLISGTGDAVWFLMLGLAAIFLFSGANVLPTSKNNRRYIMKRAESAVAEMETHLQGYDGVFPVPARYAHTIVLKRMMDAVENGRADTAEAALAVLKSDLQALNASVTVAQEEYEEVVAIKAMFLNENYE